MLKNKAVPDFGKLAFPEGKKISRAGEDFIRRLLQREPKKRMNIEEALGH